jgi:hypothetical protein
VKIFALALTLLAPLLSAAQTGNSSASDPFNGTWRLDVAKSTFKPGPPPTSETVTISPDRVSVHDVMKTDNGETVSDWSYKVVPEGKPAQINGNGMENSTVTSRRIDERTLEHTWNFNGAILHGRAVVSKNGKTMRYTLTGTGRDGQPVHDVEVYEKEGS